LSVEAFADAIEAGLNTTAAQQAADDLVARTVECGLSGRDPATGACINPDAAAVAAAESISAGAAAEYAERNPTTTTKAPTVAPAAPTTTPATNDAVNGAAAGDGPDDKGPDVEKSAGVPIIPIAAGAGGALLIIIIVIIVVVMRRKHAKEEPEAQKEQNRTVVAFDNPMYDDPGDTTNPDGTSHCHISLCTPSRFKLMSRN